MTVALESPPIYLDQGSSERHQPYGIITADCTGAKEYDDGLYITPLPDSSELYQVNVFAVDTSQLYKDSSIVKRVHQLTESKYDDPNTGYESYKPMLDPDLTRSLHFLQGTVRNALVLSFTVGARQPMSDVSISHGKVEVRRNYTYRDFSDKCRRSASIKAYGRAAAYIIRDLSSRPDDIESTYRSVVANQKNMGSWKNGSYINQTYMVAANHLVGKLMRDEGRLALYRTHDKTTTRLTDVLPPEVARYSIRPARHDGLNIDPYTRVTSPLRRGEDFIMHGLLRARANGKKMTGYDQWAVRGMEGRLNLRVCAEQFNGTARKSNDEKVLETLH